MKITSKVHPDSKSFILLIALYTILPPLVIDTYSPAIPNIAQYFNVNPSLIISTFTTYFVGYALGLLVWGPTSDTFGRKKILYSGVILYIISTIFCSISIDFWQFSAARILQGFGDSACTTVAFAIVRDCFEKKKLTKILATIIMIFMVAPIIAPFIGLVIMNTTGEWQYIFHFLTLYGFVILFFSFKMPETVNRNNSTGLGHAFKQYLEHIRNFKFILLVVGSGIAYAAYFIFIGCSAVVYMKSFGTDKIEYVFLFAINAVAALLANYLLKKFCTKISNHIIITFSAVSGFLSSVIGFILLYNFSHSILLFMIFMWLVTLSLAICITCLTSEALNSIKHSFGVGISISNAAQFIFAALTLLIISQLNYKTMGHSLFFIQASLLIILLLIIFTCLKIKFLYYK